MCEQNNDWLFYFQKQISQQCLQNCLSNIDCFHVQILIFKSKLKQVFFKKIVNCNKIVMIFHQYFSFTSIKYDQHNSNILSQVCCVDITLLFVKEKYISIFSINLTLEMVQGSLFWYSKKYTRKIKELRPVPIATITYMCKKRYLRVPKT